MNKKVKKAVGFCKKHKRKIATVAIFGVGVVVGVKLNGIKYKDAFVQTGKPGEKIRSFTKCSKDIICCSITSEDKANELASPLINDFINKYFTMDYPAKFEDVNGIIFFGNEK